MTKETSFLPERESKNVEFKSTVPDFEKLVKTCIAFANGNGGQLIIGVSDKKRELLGITDLDRDRIYDEFPNSLYDSVSPTLFVHIYEKRIEASSVLIIQVPPSPKKPYFLKKEGIPRGIYVRVGPNTRRASQDYINDLVREGNRLTFDEEALPQKMEILSKPLLRQFYNEDPNINKLLLDKIITRSLTDANVYCPTVTGVLYFTQDPHFYLPEASVICTLFKGESGREILRTKELTGPIEKLAEDTMNLAVSWLSQGYKLKGVHLKEEIPVPKEALREAIINALIHRKYSIPGAIKIAIYEDHIEITNPGGLPGLMDLDNLGDGTSFLRNPHLARLGHRSGLVEKLGSGIRLILDSCKEANLVPPLYYEGGDLLKITLFFKKLVSKERIVLAKSEETTVLSLFKTNKDMSIRDLMLLLNISRNTATRKLKVFVNQGKIIRTGKGPAIRYRLADKDI